MFDHIENMRKQSLAKRRFFAFSISLCIVGVIFAFWVAVRIPDVTGSRKVDTSKFATPDQAISANVSTAVSSISDLIKQLPSMSDYLSTTSTTTTATSTPEATTTPPSIPASTTEATNP
jgi:cytoskeletal protein RodZ